MSEKIRLKHLRPDQITIPDVRVKSIWDDEDWTDFEGSIETQGIKQPVKCILEDKTFWLIDGQHRIEEALRLGIKQIPVAYTEGTLRDAMLENLGSNRLRGKTPASDEVKVIRHLMEKDGLSIDEIAEKTGLKRERIEQRLQIGKAAAYVLHALELEKIGVGVAFHLSRLLTEGAQIEVLARLLQAIPPYTTEEVKEVVDMANDIRREMEQAPPREAPIIPVKTLACHLCGQNYEPGDLRGINICVTCHGLARDWIQRRLNEQKERLTPVESFAQKLAKTDTTEPAEKVLARHGLQREEG